MKGIKISVNLHVLNRNLLSWFGSGFKNPFSCVDACWLPTQSQTETHARPLVNVMPWCKSWIESSGYFQNRRINLNLRTRTLDLTRCVSIYLYQTRNVSFSFPDLSCTQLGVNGKDLGYSTSVNPASKWIFLSNSKYYDFKITVHCTCSTMASGRCGGSSISRTQRDCVDSDTAAFRKICIWKGIKNRGP